MRRLFANKGPFEFDWITIVDSLKVMDIPFYCGENILRRSSKNFTALNIKAWLIRESVSYIFRSAKSQRRHSFVSEFDTSSVWPLRNSEFHWIHPSQVWRSFDSLPVKKYMHMKLLLNKRPLIFLVTTPTEDLGQNTRKNCSFSFHLLFV